MKATKFIQMISIFYTQNIHILPTSFFLFIVRKHIMSRRACIPYLTLAYVLACKLEKEIFHKIIHESVVIETCNVVV